MPGPGQATPVAHWRPGTSSTGRFTHSGAGGSAAAEWHRQPRWLLLQRALTAVGTDLQCGNSAIVTAHNKTICALHPSEARVLTVAHTRRTLESGRMQTVVYSHPMQYATVWVVRRESRLSTGTLGPHLGVPSSLSASCVSHVRGCDRAAGTSFDSSWMESLTVRGACLQAVGDRSRPGGEPWHRSASVLG
jgi:hypothetical protein